MLGVDRRPDFEGRSHFLSEPSVAPPDLEGVGNGAVAVPLEEQHGAPIVDDVGPQFDTRIGRGVDRLGVARRVEPGNPAKGLCAHESEEIVCDEHVVIAETNGG